VLLNIAGQLGGIEPLFDTMFSFLYRKTDYFHVMQPGDKIGFKAGVAKLILQRSFEKFERQAAIVAADKERAAPKPAAAADVEPKAAPPKAELKGAPPPPSDASPAAASAPVAPASAPATKTAAAATAAAPDGAVPVSDAADAKSALAAEKAAAPYNGGQCANFSWEQTLSDVTIHAPVPVGTKARDIVCTIGRSHLVLKLKNAPQPIVDADYPCDARNGSEVWERVKAVDCYWNLSTSSGQPTVSVYLEKERESWWKSAVHGAEEIDTTKVDSTRDMYDYDDETQGAIRKIMFDQHQKRMGQSTSDELKNEEMLREAWNAEGSPFKGQPFDPSRVNMK